MADNHKANTMLTARPISKLTRMALPTLGGLFAIMATDLTDAYFVSLLGAEPLAALGFAFPVLLVMISVGIGLSAGVSACVAKAAGSGMHQDELGYLRVGLVVATIIGSLVALGLLLFHHQIFGLMGASADIRDMLIWPMILALSGMALLIITMSGMGALRGRGQTGGPGIAMITVAISNMVLDPIFIFGFGPIPAMGLTGSMLATLMARAMGLAMILYMLHRAGLLKPLMGQLNFIGRAKSLLYVGLPAALTNIIIPLANGVITALVARHGEVAVAGYSVAARIETIILVAFYSYSGVFGPFMGQNLAAGMKQRMQEASKHIALICLFLGLAMAMLLVTLGPFITGAFGAGAEVQKVANGYLTVIPWAYGGYGLTMVIVAGFNGMQHIGNATFIALGRSLVTMVPLAYLGEELMGLDGIWLAIAASHVLWGLIAYGLISGFISRQSNDANVKLHPQQQ
ncbi:MAG: MATE family efflux transporter [SAR116 cluster bacterium]|nr:hypothetical protein [Paracoccaceae bacterium]MAW14721.1 hypothetical protein [Paracoccaceae bacterium]RCL80153.1 MAG: MATE family efflux transporter [SAR116 cluster bacterium]|tara:strand:+ start:1545 stop:2921 length:1377 start_codon:yes stop_codon:yes gene_type:complete